MSEPGAWRPPWVAGTKGEPAPLVRVTEVVDGVVSESGRYVDRNPSGPVTFGDLCPAECHELPAVQDRPNPRGRFRVTVEFWPEGKGR